MKIRNCNLYQFNEKSARAVVRSYIRRGFVKRRLFAYDGRFTTMKVTSAERFVEAVEALGGWVVEAGEFWWRGQKHYDVVFCIIDLPDLGDWCDGCGHQADYCTCQ